MRLRTYQLCKMFPVRHMVAQNIEKQELTQALEEKIPALAQENGGKLNAVLIGLGAAFRQAGDKFLDQLEDYIRTSMSKMYTPQQLTRRSKESDHQLSQNMADPDRKKELEGFTRFTASALSITTSSELKKIDGSEEWRTFVHVEN